MEAQTVLAAVIGFLTSSLAQGVLFYTAFRKYNVMAIDKVGEAAVEHANANATSVQTTGESLTLHNRAINELLERDYQYVAVMRELHETKEELIALRKTVSRLEEDLGIERQLRQVLQKELDQERKRRYVPVERSVDQTDPIPHVSEE